MSKVKDPSKMQVMSGPDIACKIQADIARLTGSTTGIKLTQY